MDRNSRIMVTGAAGMVGRALVTRLKRDHPDIVGLTRTECDLEDRDAVRRVFAEFKPEYVFHVAAKVGGIKANISDPVAFLQSNLLSQTHVIESSHAVGVKKFLFLGSSCIYPREAPQPMREDSFLKGPPEPTNEGYAIAKIAGIRLTQYYHRQYGMKVSIPLPCNIYGPGDSFDLEHCHVLSALVKRFVDARAGAASEVTLWGTGSARREFIYLDDVVDGIAFCMDKTDTAEILNLGSGVDFSIQQLAQMVSELAGYKGKIKWDSSKPDGMPRKCLEVSKLKVMGFEAKMPLPEGIRKVIADYESKRAGERA